MTEPNPYPGAPPPGEPPQWAQEMFRGAVGAVQLAAGRAEGIDQMGDDPGAARRSFLIALFVVPAVLLQALIAANPFAGDLIARLVGALVIAGLGWLGFLALAARIAAQLGRAERLALFATGYNWSLLVQGIAILLLQIFQLFGLAGGMGGLIADALLLVWILWYTGFIARAALAITAAQAALIAAAKLMVGLTVTMLVSLLLPEAGLSP